MLCWSFRVRLFGLAILAAASALMVESCPRVTPQPALAQKYEARRRLLAARAWLKTHRPAAAEAAIQVATDPARTGLIGRRHSPVTSTVGRLSSKQLSTQPDWAAVMVHWLHVAGVRRGDVVAAGLSGSFPALNLALYAAAAAMQVQLVVVVSAAASSWGANDPHFLWLDMERITADAGLWPRSSVAASLGGVHDGAEGMPAEGVNLLYAGIRRNGCRLLQRSTLGAAIQARMALFDAKRGTRPLAAYVNIGGGAASVGERRGQGRFRPGLNLRPPPGPGTDSVMWRMSKRGVPVVHVTHIHALAGMFHMQAHGMTASPTPRLNLRGVYRRPMYNRNLAAALAVLLAALSVWCLRLPASTST